MPRKLHFPEQYRSFAMKLARTGVYQPVGPHRGYADFAGKGELRCERPFRREISSVIRQKVFNHLDDQPPDHRRKITDIDLRCRKCPACLRARGVLWRLRATEEISLSVRTWFCTFTLAPHQHAAILHRILLQASRGGSPRLENDIPPEELFLERHRAINSEFTKYFKRLRKKGYRFRYLLVLEAHKSGLPHYHALIHDCSITKPLVHRAIGSDWNLGFSQAKLVPDNDGRAINYCTKYLMKSAISRVRASVGYGQAVRKETHQA